MRALGKKCAASLMRLAIVKGRSSLPAMSILVVYRKDMVEMYGVSTPRYWVECGISEPCRPPLLATVRWMIQLET